MLSELLVWLGVIAVAFVAWSLYASADSSSTRDEQDTLRRDE